MSLSLFGANASLSFSGDTARVKAIEFKYDYAINAEESQGAYDRVFYPHRRSQGSFSVTVDCNGHAEYVKLMNWLKAYMKAVQAAAQTSSQPPVMSVSIPARNFSRIGILTTGIDSEDHVGAMVYRRELAFVSISDPNDSLTSILKTSQVSNFHAATYDPATSSFFYPSTNNTATKDQELYDAPSGPAALPSPHQGQTTGAGF